MLLPVDYPQPFSGPEPTGSMPDPAPPGSPTAGQAQAQPFGPPAPPGQYAQGSANMAATVLVSAALGAALGASRYGAKGGAVGFFLVGSAWNLVRAVRLKSDPDPARKDEALWSGIYAVAGLGASGWLAYQLSQK